MTTCNRQLELAEAFVQETDRHLFLTGRAGTGKTTFLHNLRTRCPKRMVVAAPTGVAAINAGGVTLHSLFQLPFGPILPGLSDQQRQHRFSKQKRQIIKNLDLLVIDEISMVRADMLDGVDQVLRRFRDPERPFGGAQVLMIGDLLQLPPVVKENDWQLLRTRYASPYFFSAQVLAACDLLGIELTHIFRQSDSRFIDLLNQVRDNRVNQETLDALNTRYRPDAPPEEEAGFIHLCTHNRQAESINQHRLDALPDPGTRFAARVEGTFPEQAFPTQAAFSLKVGAQVMFIRNDPNPDRRYFNGKLARITEVSDDGVRVQTLDDDTEIAVEPATWENIEYRLDPDSAEITRAVIGTFQQLPLRLAWAITVHKSQGLTFDRAVLDLQAAFAHGQVYVALSRCRSLEGIVLAKPLTQLTTQADPAIEEFLAVMANRPASQGKLDSARNHYQRRLLLDCYGFGPLLVCLNQLLSFINRHGQVLQVHGGANLPAVHTAVRTEICVVGEKFQRQLQGLFKDEVLPGDDPVIEERLRKASGYFEPRFQALLQPLLDELAIETDNRDLQRRARDLLARLREAIVIKRTGVIESGAGFAPQRLLKALSKAVLEEEGPGRGTSKGATYGEADVAHPQLFERLLDWRTAKAKEQEVALYQVLHRKTLIQIAVQMPITQRELLLVKGIGPQRADRYGQELIQLVSEYRREQSIDQVVLPEPREPSPELAKANREAGGDHDTRAVTLALHRQGLSIEQIATQRDLNTSTIQGHLAQLIEQGQVAIEDLVPESRRRLIAQQYATLSEPGLKALKEKLGHDFEYPELKMVVAHLRRSQRLGDQSEKDHPHPS